MQFQSFRIFPWKLIKLQPTFDIKYFNAVLSNQNNSKHRMFALKMKSFYDFGAQNRNIHCYFIFVAFHWNLFDRKICSNFSSWHLSVKCLPQQRNIFRKFDVAWKPQRKHNKNWVISDYLCYLTDRCSSSCHFVCVFKMQLGYEWGQNSDMLTTNDSILHFEIE